MNLNTWMQVRHQTWQSFSRVADALFELADALTCESTAKSLPELSLSPCFRQQWPSIYEALEDGKLERERWTQGWTKALLTEHEGPVKNMILTLANSSEKKRWECFSQRECFSKGPSFVFCKRTIGIVRVVRF